MCAANINMLTTSNGISPLKPAYISHSVAPIAFTILSNNMSLTVNDIITTVVANHPNMSMAVIVSLFLLKTSSCF